MRMKAKSNVGPMTVARLPINQGRNRYRDVLPGREWKRGRYFVEEEGEGKGKGWYGEVEREWKGLAEGTAVCGLVG